jgi:hypothetical protein
MVDFASINKFNAAVKAANPEDIPTVQVKNYKRPQRRHYSFQDVTGPEAAVAAYVAHVFKNDYCTPCYEHMLWTIAKVEYKNDGEVFVTLSKSHYAGD